MSEMSIQKPVDVRTLADRVTSTAEPVINAKPILTSETKALQASHNAEVLARKKGPMRVARKTGVGRVVDVHLEGVKEINSRRDQERADMEEKRQRLQSYEEQLASGVLDGKQKDHQRRRCKAQVNELSAQIFEWESNEPVELSQEQQTQHDRLLIAKEKIGQNELYQQELLMDGLMQSETQLLDPQHNLDKKAGVLLLWQQTYTTIGELSRVGLALNQQSADLWRQSGVLNEHELNQLETWEKVDEADANTRRNKNPIMSEHADLFSRPLAELTEAQQDERSLAYKKQADRLLTELEGVKNRSLDEAERKAYLDAWGFTETTVNGKQVYGATEGSVLETLQMVEARKADAKDAFVKNMEALRAGDTDCAQTAYEAANLLVRAEAADVITHAMVLEQVNQVDAQHAIKAAQKLGGLDVVDRLQLLKEQSREVVNKCSRAVRDGMQKMWGAVKEGIKDETTKKGLLALLLLLIGPALAYVAFIKATLIDMGLNAEGQKGH
jgi:hypothetical protein